MRDPTRAKAEGVHYTPDPLASFLAEETLRHLLPAGGGGAVRVLDPACGAGGLLGAVARSASPSLRPRLVLAGLETDPEALAAAREVLAGAGVGAVALRVGDFLEGTARPGDGEVFDVVIANPPYVRTQVLGAERSRALARRFGLSGRVDLAHAFVAAIAAALRPGGVLGLLASNRFLVTQSGASVRALLAAQFDPLALYDLGDTRLFPAAVLPAILIARKRAAPPVDGERRAEVSPAVCPFGRVYSHRGPAPDARDEAGPPAPSALDALRSGISGRVETARGPFVIERGVLARPARAGGPWSLTTPGRRGWLASVEAHRAGSFADVGRVRVGIKTTADRVFVRDDWDALPPRMRPEPELLLPILTHRDAGRWRPRDGHPGLHRVLYTHTLRDGRRAPIELDDYPRAREYLLAHREVLEARAYLRKAGRRWYEIWVPQDPADWPRPKLVLPDIAERPRCFLDLGGSVVNGDCYWIAPKPGADPRWLPIVLAVANSSFILAYYDALFHNKLYAGRRRFITQYVDHFPLPPLDGPRSARMGTLVAELTSGAAFGPGGESAADRELDRLVWESFGLPAPGCGT